jgi:uncharacterized protein (TIGR00369 family)
MSRETHYRKLERMYVDARCNQYYRPDIRISDAQATVTIPIEPKLHHAAGAAHGTVYFKVADDSMYFAVQSLVEDAFVLTFHLSLYLLKPILAGTIEGRGRVTFSSSRMWHAEALLVDADGREIGRATGSFAKSQMPLTPETGYRLDAESSGASPNSSPSSSSRA